MKEDQAMRRAKALRLKVLGPGYAETSLTGDRPVSEALHDLVIRYGWGEAWEGRHLDLKMRSIIMVALLATLDRPNQLKVHIQGAINNGASRGEIVELLKHVAVVCGAPCALDAAAVADGVFRAQKAANAARKTAARKTAGGKTLTVAQAGKAVGKAAGKTTAK